MISYCLVKTAAVGELLLVANASELIGLYFAGQACDPGIKREWVRDDRHDVFRAAGEQLEEYFAGKRKKFALPLAAVGTAFQKAIWREIALIPFGETITYGELARRAGKPRAIRAAGTATGKNPLGILVPCHRVVGVNGALGGFAGGLDNKRALLAVEGKSTSGEPFQAGRSAARRTFTP